LSFFNTHTLLAVVLFFFSAGLLDEKNDAVVVQPTPLICSWRFVLAIVGFFMFFHLYAQRVGMSVAIVSMVNQTAIRQKQLEAAASADLQLNASNISYFTSSSSDNELQCKRQEDSGNSTRRVCVLNIKWNMI
jgi:hypothetical protein